MALAFALALGQAFALALALALGQAFALALALATALALAFGFATALAFGFAAALARNAIVGRVRLQVALCRCGGWQVASQSGSGTSSSPTRSSCTGRTGPGATEEGIGMVDPH